MDTTHRGSALTFAGAAAGLSTARPRTADFPEKLLRIIMPYLCRHPGKRHGAIQFAAGGGAAEASPHFAGYLFDRAWERSQTATHIFGLALAMSRASAPRIQYRQEGPWIIT